VKGGIIGGRLFSVKEVEALSRLPSRLELIGILMGTMNAPLTHLMYAMNGVASKLVRTLAAVAEQKGTAAAA
jgi:large subunit ribosomal protein L10